MDASSSLGFGSVGFIEALYEDFLADPASVPTPWRREFESWGKAPVGASHGAVQARFRERARHPAMVQLAARQMICSACKSRMRCSS